MKSTNREKTRNRPDQLAAHTFRRRPALIERAQARLRAALIDGTDPAICAAICGHEDRRAAKRRTMRREGRINLYSALSQVLDYVQPNGAVLRQRAGSWIAPTHADLAGLAFGQPIANELNPEARFTRHAADLRRRGLLSVTRRWEQVQGATGELIFKGRAAALRLCAPLFDALDLGAAARQWAREGAIARTRAKIDRAARKAATAASATAGRINLFRAAAARPVTVPEAAPAAASAATAPAPDPARWARQHAGVAAALALLFPSDPPPA